MGNALYGEVAVNLSPFQAKFVRHRRRGLSVAQAAAKSGVSRSTGYNWDAQLSGLATVAPAGEGRTCRN